MRWHRFVLGLTVGLLCVPSAARGILFETSVGVRRGYVVGDDGKQLTIEVLTADGKKMPPDKYALDAIKIIHKIDPKRLEKLSKAEAYREYADELVTAKKSADDPEARPMAMRLFLIAAYLDPERLGPSCLRSMSSLAGTPAEAKRCQAMAYLVDPKGDGGALKTDSVKPAQIPKAQADALKEFVKALQCYRTGQIDAVRKSIQDPAVAKIFGSAPDMADRKPVQWCIDAECATCRRKGKVKSTCTACDGTGVNQAFLDGVTRIIVRAELWAMDRLSGGDAGKPGGETKWSSILQERVSPVLPLSWDTLLLDRDSGKYIDPRKYLYKRNAWVAP